MANITFSQTSTCDANALLLQGKCLKLNVISEKMQKAVSVYCMAAELAALHGTDYTNAITTTLLQDANAFTCGMSESEMQVVWNVLDCVNAANAGATTPDTITPVLCLEKATEKQIDNALLYLKCLLGKHASKIT